MNGRNSLVTYAIMLLVVGGVMYFILQQGEALQGSEGQVGISAVDSIGPFNVFLESLKSNVSRSTAILFLQIISIILASRVFAFIFNKIGQPTVIGEIVAGIMLGPSLLGLLLPDVSAFLFPAESLPNLKFLSQVGLVLFMFVIGMELDLPSLKNHARKALFISHGSIVIAFIAGSLLAYFLYGRFGTQSVPFMSFALFMGVALSIAAFPVLARIIQERDLTKTQLGTMVITAAAIDDLTAWCLLALVIAIVQAGTFVSALYTIGMAISFVLVMLFAVQPLLKRIGSVYSERETISKMIVAVAFLVLLSSAYLAEIIGIHALFGAFVAGVVMPPNFNFRKVMMEKVEDVSVVLLLPLFFVFTGLRTQIGLLNETHLWVVCLWIISTAVAAKLGGSALAAKLVGNSWKDSLLTGVLMNTRGLMELIVLNIGYDLGVLSPEIFAMMVIMALVTTFMTGPALNLINYIFPESESGNLNKSKSFKILLSFGPAIKGKKLLRLADQLTHKKTADADITALHLTPSADINPKDARAYEHEAFRLVRHEAESLSIRVKTIYKATNDINKEITGEANRNKYDLLLVGGSRGVFSADVVGGKVRNYLEDTQCQVGVLVDKDFEVADRIVLVLQDFSDLFLITFAERFIQNNNAKVVLSDPNRLIKMNTIFRMAVEKINTENPKSIEVHESHAQTEEFFSRFNLFIISYASWKHLNRSKNPWLAYTPSILILKPAGKL